MLLVRPTGYLQKRINGPQNPVQPKRTGPRLARLEKGSSLRVADGPTETESASLCQVETRGSQVPSTERRGKRTSSSAAMAKQGAKKMKDENKKRLDLLLRIILISNVSTRLQSPLPSPPLRRASRGTDPRITYSARIDCCRLICCSYSSWGDIVGET